MTSYDLFMYPFEKIILRNIRKEIIQNAYGSVLEIGMGTGANLPYYNYNKIDKIVGLDVNISSKIKNKFNSKTEILNGQAENIPFKDKTFDVIVSTLVLCSVEDVNQSVCEIKRVLKDDGIFIFMEHILPEGKNMSSFFNNFNNIWGKFAHNCNINRSSQQIIMDNFPNINYIKKSGFTIVCHGIVKK